MDGPLTIHRKAVEQYFTVVLFMFQFSSDCNFGKLLNFGLNTLGNESVNGTHLYEQ